MKKQELGLYIWYIESLDGSPEVFFGKFRDFHSGAVLGVGADSAFWLDGQNWYFLCQRYYMKELMKSLDCIVYTITTWVP